MGYYKILLLGVLYLSKIYLIRHGQSEWNKLYKIQGQKDTKLTDIGKQQAMNLGDRLIKENIDIIYSSDLERAYITANIISKMINKPVVPNVSIREIGFGPWEGLSLAEIKKRFNKEYSIWLNEPHKLNLEGAENLQILKDRAMKFVNQVINENKGKNIAIVSHSATLKIIILGLLGIDISFYKNITLSNVSLSIVECRDYNNVLTLLNDTSHIKEL